MKILSIDTSDSNETKISDIEYNSNLKANKNDDNIGSARDIG